MSGRMTRHDAYEFIHTSHGASHDCCDPLSLHTALDACCPSNQATPAQPRLEGPMYVAMNRFRVKRGSEIDFEKVWLSRDTHLSAVPGFVTFDLLKGPESEDHTLYASHTVWETEDHFRDWTRSAAFREAHKDAGRNAPLYDGSPQFEGFSSIQSVGADK